MLHKHDLTLRKKPVKNEFKNKFSVRAFKGCPEDSVHTQSRCHPCRWSTCPQHPWGCSACHWTSLPAWCPRTSAAWTVWWWKTSLPRSVGQLLGTAKATRTSERSLESSAGDKGHSFQKTPAVCHRDKCVVPVPLSQTRESWGVKTWMLWLLGGIREWFNCSWESETAEITQLE